jgi:hypothetical protein
MRSDRAAAGLSGTAILVVIALAPGGYEVMEWVLLTIAGLVAVATFAPALPVLHQLPKVGAPRVRVALSFEPDQDGSEELRVVHVEGRGVMPRVLRVGFINDGPKCVRGALVNVLVDARVEMTASDHLGDTNYTHGRAMPLTEVDGLSMRFWADKDLTLPVGSHLLDYRLSFPDVLALGDSFLIRVQYDSDDLYGSERIYEQRVPVQDLKDAFVR